MKKIGFFGGTFDPIHFGHLHLAIQLFEIHRLDEVLFCPAFCSPLKSATPPIAQAKDRLSMVQLALEGIPHFRVTNAEVERGGLSYTIDTLRDFQKKEKGKFYLLLSEEAAIHFDLWKEAQELLRLAPPLIGARAGFSLQGPLSTALRKGLTLTRIMEISSSEIRGRLKQKLYCGHYVPAKALDYIVSHRLY